MGRVLCLGALIVLLWMTHAPAASAQDSRISKFKSLSRPEKCWVMLHPFAASKAWRATQLVEPAVSQLKRDSTLDGNTNGGQLDAFRHAYWMAVLCQEIRWRKAWKLGKAHERGNKIDWRKGREEDGSVPDKAATDMDLFNNRKGIEIGRQVKADGPEVQLDTIKKAVLKQLKAGELRIISIAADGTPLDQDGNPIPPEQLKAWETPRCLVPSN